MNRRLFLRGLVAMPAIVAAGSLMPVRGIVMPWPDLLIGRSAVLRPPWPNIGTARMVLEEYSADDIRDAFMGGEEWTPENLAPYLMGSYDGDTNTLTFFED